MVKPCREYNYSVYIIIVLRATCKTERENAILVKSVFLLKNTAAAEKDRTRMAMELNEYQQLALKTLNPELDEKDVLINGVMGLCGESGEAIDIVKKHLAQGHELDRQALAKELGDVAWYLAETARAIGYSLEDICRMNIEKLAKRYPGGFSSEKSVNREE